MRRFESLVMSVNEPVTDGTLWIRQKKNTIKDTATNTIPPAGMSIWWYGERGWMPLVDLDTRYDLHDAYATDGVNDPVDITVVSKPEVGIVDITMTFSIYDATRALADNANLVNETGLKHHVDNLQNQIDELDKRVTVLESKVGVLETKVSALESEVASLKTSVQKNTSAIEANKKSITELTSKLTEFENKVTANTSAIESLKSQVEALGSNSAPAE